MTCLVCSRRQYIVFTACTGFRYELVQECARRSNNENFSKWTRFSGKAKIITVANKAKEIVDKFKLKCGNSDLKKYYEV